MTSIGKEQIRQLRCLQRIFLFPPYFNELQSNMIALIWAQEGHQGSSHFAI